MIRYSESNNEKKIQLSVYWHKVKDQELVLWSVGQGFSETPESLWPPLPYLSKWMVMLLWIHTNSTCLLLKGVVVDSHFTGAYSEISSEKGSQVKHMLVYSMFMSFRVFQRIFINHERGFMCKQMRCLPFASTFIDPLFGLYHLNFISITTWEERWKSWSS